MPEGKAKSGGLFKNKKLRPWLIGGVVLVGVVVLFVMMRNRGGGGDASAGAAGPSEALQAAQLQAATQVSLGAQAANVEAARIAGEIETTLHGQDVQGHIADLQAQAATYASSIAGQVQLAGIAAQTQIAQAQENTAQANIAAAAGIQMAGINAQTAIAQAQFGYLTQQDTNRTSVDLARINADVAIAKRQSGNRTANFLGGLVGGFLGVFSDIRVKKNVAWTGESVVKVAPGGHLDEYGRYSWTYRGGNGSVFTGIIAQEIRRIAPQSVMPVRSGRYLAVDYGALPT